MKTDGIPKDWLRGVLDPCLLALLADGEAYGYELATKLADAGIGPVPAGSMYPALLRLHKQGFLEAEWRAGEGGPGRKYYRLTTAGGEELGNRVSAWRVFASSVEAILEQGARR